MINRDRSEGTLLNSLIALLLKGDHFGKPFGSETFQSQGYPHERKRSMKSQLMR